MPMVFQVSGRHESFIIIQLYIHGRQVPPLDFALLTSSRFAPAIAPARDILSLLIFAVAIYIRDLFGFRIFDVILFDETDDTRIL